MRPQRPIVATVAAIGLFAACELGAQTPTKTNLDDINVADTREDPAYETSGEDLARTAARQVIGQPAPVAVMKTIDGETIDLGKIYGHKPVYIKFWATWCVPCRQQMPAFEKVYETMGGKMQVIALNVGLSDDEVSARRLREKYGLRMPIVMDDGRLGALFHLNVTPQHVLIGRDGRFAYLGHAENAALSAAINNALSKPAGAAAVATAQSTERVIKVGERVGERTVTTTAGASVALGKNQSGRLRAVQFFSSWCEWYLEKTRPQTAQGCARTRAAIERLARSNKSIDWIGIAGGPWATPEDLADYQRKHKVTIPLALDKSGVLFRAFGIRDIPTIALIDASGRLLRLVGPDEQDLAHALNLSKSDAPSPPVSTGG